MKLFRLSLLALLLCGGLVHAQNINLPKEMTIPPKRLNSISFTHDGTINLTWKFIGPGKVFREYSEDPKEVKFQVLGLSPGQPFYLIVAASNKEGKLVLECCTINVEGEPAPPPPPGPGPGPGPKPPTPPPENTLKQRLKEAFDADKSAHFVKKAQLYLLAGAYSSFSKHTSDDKKIKTAGDLKADLEVLGKDFHPTALTGMRRVIAEELRALAGANPDTNLATDTRSSIIALIAIIIQILEFLSTL